MHTWQSYSDGPTTICFQVHPKIHFNLKKLGVFKCLACPYLSSRISLDTKQIVIKFGRATNMTLFYYMAKNTQKCNLLMNCLDDFDKII